MKQLYFLIALGALLLLAACTGEQSNEMTGQVVGEPVSVNSETVSKPVKSHEFEIYLKQTVDGDGDIESENLFPETLTVGVGDNVKLVFLLDEQKFISIDGIDFAEKVQNDVVEFVAREAGMYSMLCLDCENTAETLLLVE